MCRPVKNHKLSVQNNKIVKQMSVMPGSTTTLAARNGSQDRETFHKFFECWLGEQHQHLEELVSVSKEREELEQAYGQNGEVREVDQRRLCPLLERVIRHYEHYYNAKSRWATNHVLSMFNPSWRSSLEDAFLWIGGWRPSMAFHLLYSKSGIQLEAGLAKLIRGLSTGDLGDLSPSQLEQVDELQKRTIKVEKEITEKFAKKQETVVDSSMVELSHVVTEMIREGDVDQAMVDTRVEEALVPKEEGMVEVLKMADELRLKTLKEVLNILNPVQGVHFLIAAAELHLRVHEWGKRKDATRNHHGEPGSNQQN